MDLEEVTPETHRNENEEVNVDFTGFPNNSSLNNPSTMPPVVIGSSETLSTEKYQFIPDRLTLNCNKLKKRGNCYAWKL